MYLVIDFKRSDIIPPSVLPLKSINQQQNVADEREASHKNLLLYPNESSPYRIASR